MEDKCQDHQAYDVVQEIAAVEFKHLIRKDAERGKPTSTALNMELVQDKLSLLGYDFISVQYPDQSDIYIAVQIYFQIKG